MADSDSDNESFHSFEDDREAEQPPPAERPRQPRTDGGLSHDRDPTPKKAAIERFPPDEEAALLASSNSLKTSGNQLFGKGSFENAIQTYGRALSATPNYLDYELAVLRSNIAACHLKLEEWKDSIASADKGIDSLENLEPLPRPPRNVKGKAAGKEEQAGENEEQVVEEVDDDVEERIENLRKSGRTLDEVRKLQVKLLTRRAKAKAEMGGWASLQGADEDYKTLLSPSMLPCLSPTDRRSVVDAATKLGPRLNEAKDKEMAEMMDKLKGLGNTILKPFGLSTENFQFTPDGKGGYGMNFSQGAGKK